MKIAIFLIFIALFSFSDTLSQGTSGNLDGWLANENGEPLELANIFISSKSLLGIRGTSSNKDGYFIFASIPPGKYTVTISCVSYRKYLVENVVVTLEKTTSLGKIMLEREVVGLEEIVVNAERSVIDISSTSYGQNFKDENLVLLPLERDYQQISQLTPEAKESYLGDGISIAGASGKENKYFINGVPVTDPYANWYATRLPYNFVKEIQINVGAYLPEYESSFGGMVNVITNSGSNEFYGKAFAFFTNDKFTGIKYSVGEPSTGSFVHSDIGFGIGGPIIRDKIWFFVSYSPQFDREELLVSNLGYQNYHMTTHLFAGKLNWSLNDNNKIEIVTFGDPSSGTLFPYYIPVNATFINFTVKPPYYRGNLHALARGNHSLNKAVFLESYISLSQFEQEFNDINSPTINNPLFIDYTNGIVSGDGIYMSNRNNEINLGLKGSFQIGNHLVKAGLELLNTNSTESSDQVTISKYGDSSYYKVIFRPGGTVTHRVPTFFLQDSWIVNPYLGINIGFRWNYVFMIGSDRKVAQTIPDQIAPRIGLVFLPEGNNKQKISLSLGRFYHTFPIMLSHFFYSNSSYIQTSSYNEDPRTSTADGEIVYESHGNIYPEIDNLKGPNYDEITLGYERELPFNLYGNLKFIYRRLVEGIEDGIDPETGMVVMGNPGKGDMTAFPEMQRDFTAVELILGSGSMRNFNFQLSYILSRSYGNYTGFYDTETEGYGPVNRQYDTPEQLINGTGLLPQDRTHTFKFLGSYYFDFGLSAGTSFFISSGKPLSLKGGHSVGPPRSTFLEPRGTNGRTPTLWDLNLRLTYELNKLFGFNKRIRLIADILHVASDKTAVEYDEVKYFNVDEEGNQVDANPNYGQPIRFQPPMSLRLGLEVDF